MSRLLHYSENGLGKIRSRRQERDFFKPHGLWLSVEGPDDWPSWCRSESFNLERLGHVYEITLAPKARILWVRTAEELDEVSEAWSAPPMAPTLRSMWLRWGDMAKVYDGIIIAPYQWERRLGPLWYYPWDCASGCIWRRTAIARAELLKEAA